MKQQLLAAIRSNPQLSSTVVRTAAVLFAQLRDLLKRLPAQHLTVHENLRFI